MNTNNDIIPGSVLLEVRKHDLGYELGKGIITLQQSWKNLCDIMERESLGEIPELEEITVEWVRNLIGSRKDTVRKSATIPSEQKQTINKVWGRVETEMCRYAEVIESLVRKHPDVPFTFDQQAKTYVINDLEGYLTEKCTAEVPQEAFQHWELILKVREAIANLRSWEKERNVKKLDMNLLVKSIQADGIAQLWASGDIFYKWEEMDERTKSLMQIRDENTI